MLACNWILLGSATRLNLRSLDYPNSLTPSLNILPHFPIINAVFVNILSLCPVIPVIIIGLSIYQMLGRSHLFCVSDSFVSHNNLSLTLLSRIPFTPSRSTSSWVISSKWPDQEFARGLSHCDLNLKLSKEIFLRGSQYFPNFFSTGLIFCYHHLFPSRWRLRKPLVLLRRSLWEGWRPVLRLPSCEHCGESVILPC